MDGSLTSERKYEMDSQAGILASNFKETGEIFEDASFITWLESKLCSDVTNVLRLIFVSSYFLFSFQSLCPFPVEMIRKELQKFPEAKGK